MLHGREDQPCPPEQTTMVLAKRLRAADVHLLGQCGHNLPRERSAAGCTVDLRPSLTSRGRCLRAALAELRMQA